MAKTRQPPINSVSQGAISCKGVLLDPASEVWLFVVPGALTNGTSGDGAGWAGPGSIAVRTDTGVAYSNTGTKSSPSWVKVSGT